MFKCVTMLASNCCGIAFRVYVNVKYDMLQKGMSVQASVFLFICPSVRPSVCLYICPTVRLSVCLRYNHATIIIGYVSFSVSDSFHGIDSLNMSCNRLPVGIRCNVIPTVCDPSIPAVRPLVLLHACLFVRLCLLVCLLVCLFVSLSIC